MRKTFILLKDTPELRKGAILQEDCDAGDQDFSCINKGHIKMKDQDGTSYSRDVVMKQPNWFEEVEMLPIRKSDALKVKKYVIKI